MRKSYQKESPPGWQWFAAVTIGAILGLAMMMCAPQIARAQARTTAPDSVRIPILSPAQLDSAVRAELDTIVKAKARLDSAERILNRERYRAAWGWKATKGYAALFGAGVAANALLRIDVDGGGYVDSWGTPDKLAHFQASSFLTSAAISSGVPPWRAAIVTCAGGWAFELSQGHVSWRDGVADCAGSITSVGLSYLRRKARAAGTRWQL